MRVRRTLSAVLIISQASLADAQNPLRHFTEGVQARFDRTQPVLAYTLSARASDTTGFDVRIAIRNAPDTFHLAMAKHPEYDDRFFRFVQNVNVGERGASVTREDSTLWRVIAPAGVATVTYRVQLPASPTPRAAWRPFLTPTGMLSGGPHAFMYVVGAELAPASVRLELPESWSVATGLTPTSVPRTYFAASAYDLVESPVLAGVLRRWSFAIDGVPHTVAYWPLPGAAAFDTTAFVGNIERMAREVVRLFGRAPYREYTFQIQDGAYGALEHPNSVSLGIPSAELAKDAAAGLPETAHEFIHTWNLMRIRPAEYTGVSYRAIRPVPTLWFSEGLTLMYADLLLRRAQLPTYD
ncbi:MAG TPA: hypothetical protein VJ867_09840, partial [Gemmatimonadaceae bacterium]|nr:hypothetical protein [Gemmatimonadaceae bacterium]